MLVLPSPKSHAQVVPSGPASNQDESINVMVFPAPETVNAEWHPGCAWDRIPTLIINEIKKNFEGTIR